MYVDYTILVKVLRQKFEELLQRHPLWDGRVYCLQVTELREQTIQTIGLQVLLSAMDSPKTWDLCCDVREQMLQFVQAHYPESLFKIRLGTSHFRFPAEGKRDRQLLECS
ncbi:MAG: hypothetical protein ACUVRV_06365 [Cyanobacteriota bacterium]